MQKILAIPGFLGLSEDWNAFPELMIENVDVNSFCSSSIEVWAKDFNRSIQNTYATPQILMGYSLGGRLALHALIEQPSLWKMAIIISAHPGLKSDEEKKIRIANDEKWAQRFEHNKWETVIKEWNEQKVFQSCRYSFSRLEKNYNRQLLANQLRFASLGKQNNLLYAICQINIPIYWLVGNEDLYFKAFVNEINLKNPLSKKVLILHAGHRAPWENTFYFQQFIKDLINIK